MENSYYGDNSLNNTKGYALNHLSSKKNSFSAGHSRLNQVISSFNNSLTQSVIKYLTLIKERDETTFIHSIDVAILSLEIGAHLNLSSTDLVNLAQGALLHDVGKAFIDLSILNKEGKLTEWEYKVLKAHTILGYMCIEKDRTLGNYTKYAVLDHHESYDGKGYPRRISQNKITPFGRIISLADVYDALTSNRPYRTALNHFQAIEIIKSSRTQFDPDLLHLFLKEVFHSMEATDNN